MKKILIIVVLLLLSACSTPFETATVCTSTTENITTTITLTPSGETVKNLKISNKSEYQDSAIAELSEEIIETIYDPLDDYLGFDTSVDIVDDRFVDAVIEVDAEKMFSGDNNDYGLTAEDSLDKLSEYFIFSDDGSFLSLASVVEKLEANNFDCN